ncbi:MAG: hypothetical protein AMK72_06745 [Planctomycetes bacterium SM23_25]|nr:MAG: hypothetical protein AMK72_06745 [Planctomycetes bacterium SM23_25]
MQRLILVLVMAALATTVSTGDVQAQQDVRRLPVKEYLDRSWEPGPIANSMFTDAEKAQITSK